MEEMVNEVLLQGVLLPVAVAVIVTGVIRYGLGEARSSVLAAAAIGIAFVAGYAMTIGWPGFPPRTSGQKIGYIVLFATVIGIAIDVAGAAARLSRVVMIAAPVLIVGWLGWRVISGFDVTGMLPHAILIAAGIAVFNRLSVSYERSSTPLVMLLAACVGGAAIAFIGASGSIAQVFGTAAAAIGGYLLWNWPKARFPLGSAGLLAGGGVFVALASAMILFSETSPLAAIFLLPVFFAPLVADRLPLRDRDALAPIVLGLVAAVPVVIGIVIAFAQMGDSFEG